MHGTYIPIPALMNVAVGAHARGTHVMAKKGFALATTGREGKRAKREGGRERGREHTTTHSTKVMDSAKDVMPPLPSPPQRENGNNGTAMQEERRSGD